MIKMENDKHLKIGLDFHGVINVQPQFFAEFTAEALRRGHEIHVITGGPESFVKGELKRLNIQYSKIFAIIDAYKNCPTVTTEQNGEFHIDDKVWNKAKAEYCRCHKIDLHIDDSCTYVKWFTTPYCCYNDGCCQISKKHTLDLTKSATEALNYIEKVLFLSV